MAGTDGKVSRKEPDVLSSGRNVAKEEYVDPLDAFMDTVESEAAVVREVTLKKEKEVVRSRRMIFDMDPHEADVKRFEHLDKLEAPKADFYDPDVIIKRRKEILFCDHSKHKYVPFERAFYQPVPAIAALSYPDIVKIRAEKEYIEVKGKIKRVRLLSPSNNQTNIPAPILKWSQCGLAVRELQVLDALGFESPTPIQCQALPILMSGYDMMGCAKTGSGKTLAFLLPLIRHVASNVRTNPGVGPMGFIMAPTRELVTQIFKEALKFCRIRNLKVLCTYGGTDVKNQIGQLKQGVDILVSTPGRVIDLLTLNAGKILNLSRVTFIVIDEADRMFDMGFEPQIRQIVDCVRPDRQTVMTSATFPRQMEALAKHVLRDAIEVTVGGRSVVSNQVQHTVEVLKEEEKFRRLLELLREHYINHEECNTLIFVTHQDNADLLFRDLTLAGYPCISLHGGKDQSDRDFALVDFKNQEKRIMVATSVAARGLDVDSIRLVVNFDVPSHYEDYVHRVGRTGRGLSKGFATTFITEDEGEFAPDCVKALRLSKKPIPEELEALATKYEDRKARGLVRGHSSGFGGRGFKFDARELEQEEQERKRMKKEYDERNETKEDDSDGEEPAEEQETISIVPSEPDKITKESFLSFMTKTAENLALESKNMVDELTGIHHCEDELDINDLPPQVRFRICRKDTVEAMAHKYGTGVTNRGTYVLPGKQPKAGERRMHLLIEGPTKEAVANCKQELLEIATEMKRMQTVGRYKLV